VLFRSAPEGKAPEAARKTAEPARAVARAPRIKCPLSKAELKEFQQILLEKRRALIGDLNGIEAGVLGGARGGGSTDLSSMPTHPADVGSDNYEQEFTLGLLESERTLLAEINEALERIEQGSYGICAGTGKPISKPRLRARPWSKYSIEFAKMLEQGLVRPERHGEEPPAESAEDFEDEEEPQEQEEEEVRESDEDFEE